MILGDIGSPWFEARLTKPSIPIHERVELPESWIPADSRVEIDAKITAGMSPFPFRVFLWVPEWVLCVLFGVRMQVELCFMDGDAVVDRWGRVDMSPPLPPSLALCPQAGAGYRKRDTGMM